MPKLITLNSGKKTASVKPRKKVVYDLAEEAELRKIGKGIARLIMDSQISIERFAYENELGKGHLSRIIRGQADIKYCTLRTISKGLGFKNVASFLEAVL